MSIISVATALPRHVSPSYVRRETTPSGGSPVPGDATSIPNPTISNTDGSTSSTTTTGASSTFIAPPPPGQTTSTGLPANATHIGVGLFGGVVVAGFVLGVLLGLLGLTLFSRRRRRAGGVKRSISGSTASPSDSFEKGFSTGYTTMPPSHHQQQNGIINLSGTPHATHHTNTVDGMATMIDQISEQEAVQRVNMINESIAQMASSMAIKASGRGEGRGLAPPRSIPGPMLADVNSLKSSERSLHFENLACGVVGCILVKHLCTPFSTCLSNEQSGLFSHTNMLVEKHFDFAMATRWRAVTHQALQSEKSAHGLKPLIEALFQQCEKELTALLFWCGMEDTREAAVTLFNKSKSTLNTAAQQLDLLQAENKQKVTSSEWSVEQDPRGGRLVITSTTSSGAVRQLQTM